MGIKSVCPDEMQGYVTDWKMSPGVIVNGLLFMTGFTGRTDDGVLPTDPEQQIWAVFAKVGSVLETAGLDWSHVVEMTSYHVGIGDHLELFRSVREEHVVEPYPAWTALEVAGFVVPDAIVELKVVADATTIT